MHIRLSTALGSPIVTEDMEERVGVLDGALVHPDLGRVEGVFVRVAGFFHSARLFLPSQDIRHWGHRIRILSSDVLVPLEEIVRLQAFALEGRTVLGQRIRTESGVLVGVCRDVQFETATFRLEWIFPKTFLRWQPALPASAIVEVRPDAVIVRDLSVTEKRSVLKTLDELTEAPVPPRLPDAS